MKKMLMVCLMAAMGALSCVAQSIYDFKVTNDEGKEVCLFRLHAAVLNGKD